MFLLWDNDARELLQFSFFLHNFPIFCYFDTIFGTNELKIYSLIWSKKYDLNNHIFLAVGSCFQNTFKEKVQIEQFIFI